VNRRVGPGLAVRAARTAGFGAGAQRLVDDVLDGACAAAAFGAAAEATIDLLGIARQIFRRVDGATDIVVGDEVTGTNNHEDGRPIGDAKPSIGTKPSISGEIFKTPAGSKRKNRLFE
jgi:hypothetical protein